MYPTKVSKKSKSEAASTEPASIAVTTPPLDTATTSSELPPVIAKSTTPDVAQQTASDVALADAKAGEERIFEALAALEQQINEWIDLAPPELHEEFDIRLRKRIAEMID